MIEDAAARPSVRFLAQKVESIEEPAISPELGLKGDIDMVVSAVTTTLQTHQPNAPSPFGVELKTGHQQKTQNARMAQLSLYILMMKRGTVGNGRLTLPVAPRIVECSYI